ncbi:hypothetical protein [Haloprofundus marisrubri]|uniref:hypothetical protein n=1 Tax=Haloprofundus marisrubri TaxID=1514971 RepID=UPI00138F1FE8|nr:hypothetical protein [Haloprofundus marisrubri]
MDWRVIVAGFVVCVGLAVGWRDTGSVGGSIFAAGLLSVLFFVGWLIDKYIYGL